MSSLNLVVEAEITFGERSVMCSEDFAVIKISGWWEDYKGNLCKWSSIEYLM